VQVGPQPLQVEKSHRHSPPCLSGLRRAIARSHSATMEHCPAATTAICQKVPPNQTDKICHIEHMGYIF
jgi:hypothetical protein